MIGHILWEMFQWPQGIVVGNLIASVLWTVPVFIHTRLKMNKQHRERMDQQERHHREQMSAIRGKAAE